MTRRQCFARLIDALGWIDTLRGRGLDPSLLGNPGWWIVVW